MCHVGRVGVSPPATKTEAGLAGLRRESRTGGHLARDLARSNEEIPPRRVVRPAGAGAAGNGVGDEWRRWWRSGPRRDRARGVDEVGKRHGRPRRAALSTFPCSGEHGNDGGQLLGGAELGHGGAVAMVAQEARGARGEEEGLTARRKKGPRQVRSAGEGRIDDGCVRRPGEEEDGDPVLRGLPARVRGRSRRSGARRSGWLRRRSTREAVAAVMRGGTAAMALG